METTRLQQKQQTRQKILAAAYRVYAQKGFSAPTAEIAKEAGVSHGSIFAHFASQAQLVEAVLEQFGTQLGAGLHDLAENSADLQSLLCAHLTLLARHEQFYLHLITEKGQLPPQARLTFANLQSVAAYHFGRVLQHTAAAQNGVPPHMLFNTWMGLVHYYLMNKELFSPEAPLLPRYTDELVRTFLTLAQTGEEQR